MINFYVIAIIFSLFLNNLRTEQLVYSADSFFFDILYFVRWID